MEAVEGGTHATISFSLSINLANYYTQILKCLSNQSSASVSSGSVTGACGRYASRDHAMNDSALPQREMMQMRYRVTRCVEAIHGTLW